MEFDPIFNPTTSDVLFENPTFSNLTKQDIIPTDLAIEKDVTIDNFLDVTPLPPPLTFTTRSIEEDDVTIPGEIYRGKDGTLYKKIIEYQGVTNDLISGYDNAVVHEIPSRIFITFRDLGDGTYIHATLETYNLPTTDVNGPRPLYPSEARDRDETYSADILVRLQRRIWNPSNIRKSTKGEDHRIPDSSDVILEQAAHPVKIGKIPVMLGSVLCHLARKENVSKYEKIKAGSCAYQPDGSFIINGTDYVVLLEDQTATNKFFIYPKGDMYISIITTTTIRGSTTIKLFQDKQGVINISLRFLGSEPNSSKDKKATNIIRIIRILLARIIPNYKPNYEYIWGLIEPFINPRAAAQAKSLFNKTYMKSLIFGETEANDDDVLFNKLVDKRNRQEKYSAIKKKKKDKVKVRLTEQEKQQIDAANKEKIRLEKEEWVNANFLEIINDLFPQIPGDNLVGKLNMLMLMLARFLEFLTGNRRPDDQDRWATKKVSNAGPAMVKIFSRWYKNKFLDEIGEIFPGHMMKRFMVYGVARDFYDININGYSSNLQKIASFITKNFIDSFTFNWGVFDKKNPVKKTDILKEDNILDKISHLLRMASHVNETSTAMAPRMVQQDQLGFVDPADTPEGGTCGLVRNKTVVALVTIERDDSVIIIILNQQNYISPVKTEAQKCVCLINSKFLGWCDGVATYQFLKQLKRSKKIEYDTSIVLERIGVDVLFVHTDSGRLMRPLLTVDPETKKLNIEKDRTVDRWVQQPEQTPSEYIDGLIRDGIVEYLSPAEQSMVYVSKSVSYLQDMHRSYLNYQEQLQNLLLLKEKSKNEKLYKVTGNSDYLIDSVTKQNLEMKEKQEILDKIKSEQARLEIISSMNTEQLSKINLLQDNFSLENIQNIPESSLSKINVTSTEKLKELIANPDMNESIRKYAEDSYKKQLTIFNNMIQGDITRLDELVNGESEEQYNQKIQKYINDNVSKLEQRLQNLQSSGPGPLGTTASGPSLVGPGPNSTAITNILEKIQSFKSWTPTFQRKLSLQELSVKYETETNSDKKNQYYISLTERNRLIDSTKSSLRYAVQEKKNISLEIYTLRIKQDIITFHSNELKRQQSLIKEINSKITTLKKELNDLDSKDNGGKIQEAEISELDKNISKIRNTLIRIQKEIDFSYCEIDPNSVWGVSASVIPLPDRNQSIRNSYVCNQMRQMVGIINSNPTYQMNTTSRAIAYPARPLLEPQLNETLGLKDLPIGNNVILAIMTYEGLNQEDSLVVSQSAIDNGLFSIVKHKTVKVTIKAVNTDSKIKIISEKITDTPANPKRDKRAYEKLVNGIVELGSAVTKGDPLVSITRTTIEDGVKIEEDGSRYATIGEEGIVDRITPPSKFGDSIIVKIRLLQIRNVVAGDKLATSSGQKGTISKIVPVEDMPFTSIYNPKTGKEEMVRPDILMNPHAIPSRMTLELLFEMILGRYSALSGTRINATAFKNLNIHDFMNMLPDYGFSSRGTVNFYNGKNGQFMTGRIMVGPTYYSLLRHWVLDKIQTHGIKKKIDPQTMQPVKGRSNEGAIRMGAQERDALYAHGASKVALERYCISSDRVSVIFCNNCGNVSDMNVTMSDYHCKYCRIDPPDPVRAKIPYGMLKFIRSMGGMGFRINLGFQKRKVPIVRQEQ